MHLFNSLSRKQAPQNVHRWDQNVWVSKCLCRCWKVVLGTTANWFASPQIEDLRFRFANSRNDFLPQTFAVKKLKSTSNTQINNITGIVFAISKKKIRFFDSMYRQIWVDVFLKYNTLSPSSSDVKQLFPRGAAIFTAKWFGLRSRNFQRPIFVKENFRLFEVAKGCTRRLS